MSTDDRPRPTRQWLEELVAVGAMAAVGDEMLVLGKYRDGQYPITWMSYKDTITRDINGRRMNMKRIEVWRIFGIETREPLTKEDCERIMRSVTEG